MLTYEILTVLAESPKNLHQIRALVGDKPSLKMTLLDMRTRFGYIQTEGARRHFTYKITEKGLKRLQAHNVAKTRKYILKNLAGVLT